MEKEEQESWDYALDVFVVGTVLNGADSIDKLMMTTYLSQFGSNGKQAEVIFVPDLLIGIVPYSRKLLKGVNERIQRGYLCHYPRSEKNSLIVGLSSYGKDWMKINECVIKEEKKLDNLYKKNLNNLKKYPTTEDMVRAVKDLTNQHRERKEKLAYLK